MNISEKADKYAEGKANEAITRAIAQAYMDGYRDGYNNREQEIPEDLRENGVEYVDLGLPSGTLWASDYLKEDNEIVYLPYEKAEKMKIPTEEQYKELEKCCRFVYRTTFDYDLKSAVCIGPNGNVLYFDPKGMKKLSLSLERQHEVFIWLKDDNESSEKMYVHIYNPGKKDSTPNDRSSIYNDHIFTGYKLPVRLVK